MTIADKVNAVLEALKRNGFTELVNEYYSVTGSKLDYANKVYSETYDFAFEELGGNLDGAVIISFMY